MIYSHKIESLKKQNAAKDNGIDYMGIAKIAAGALLIAATASITANAYHPEHRSIDPITHTGTYAPSGFYFLSGQPNYKIDGVKITGGYNEELNQFPAIGDVLLHYNKIENNDNSEIDNTIEKTIFKEMNIGYKGKLKTGKDYFYPIFIKENL